MSDAITIKNFYPHRFAIDPDDEQGELQTLPLRITRFTVDQGKDFNARRAKVLDPPHERAIFRKSEGDEQAKTMHLVGTGPNARDVEIFLVSDDEIRRRRIEEMAPEARAVFLAQEADDQADEYDFLVDTLRRYVRVDPSVRVHFEIEDQAGEISRIELKTGEDLLKAFGGHRQQLTRLAAAVWAENNLSALEKKAWRSLSNSTRSSGPPPMGAPGARPDATVAPAGPEASAATAAVTASLEPTPSGSTVM